MCPHTLLAKTNWNVNYPRPLAITELCHRQQHGSLTWISGHDMLTVFSDNYSRNCSAVTAMPLGVF